MAGFIRDQQRRSKPILRLHSDGLWYCRREWKTVFGVWLGRMVGSGKTAEAAWDDLAAQEQASINRDMNTQTYRQRSA